MTTLQSLAFVAGYAVHSYFKHSKCEACLKALSEPKTFEFEETTERKFVLISLLDRESLTWPSDRVFEATIYLWRIFVKIEQHPTLMGNSITGPSRTILIQFALHFIAENESEDWREKCLVCKRLGWDVLQILLKSTTNCLLSNKVKNVNALIRSRGEDKRKLNKFKIA